MLAHRSLSMKWMMRINFIVIAIALVEFAVSMRRHHDLFFYYSGLTLLGLGTVIFIASFFGRAK